MQGKKCLLFRNPEVRCRQAPGFILTSTLLASIAGPLEYGGNSAIVFGLLEHCVHEFFFEKHLCTMDCVIIQIVSKDSYILKGVPENITMYEKRGLADMKDSDIEKLS